MLIGPRDWMPKLDPKASKALEERLTLIIRNLIREQKRITGYDGPPDNFSQWVVEQDWDWEFQATIFYSGYLQSLLEMVEMFGLKLPKDLEKEAHYFVNEVPPNYPFTA